MGSEYMKKVDREHRLRSAAKEVEALKTAATIIANGPDISAAYRHLLSMRSGALADGRYDAEAQAAHAAGYAVAIALIDWRMSSGL